LAYLSLVGRKAWTKDLTLVTPFVFEISEKKAARVTFRNNGIFQLIKRDNKTYPAE
jgi:hypothetical protein